MLGRIEIARSEKSERSKLISGETGIGVRQMRESMRIFLIERDAIFREYGIPAPGEAPEDKEALEEALK